MVLQGLNIFSYVFEQQIKCLVDDNPHYIRYVLYFERRAHITTLLHLHIEKNLTTQVFRNIFFYPYVYLFK